MFENDSKNLILASEASYSDFLKNFGKCFFAPWKFFSILRFYSKKKNRQEFIRIFKEQKSIGKGFKINIIELCDAQ